MNNWLELLAPAKINLFLELTGKRPDGFHELETVMSCVNLFDRIQFRTRDDGLIKLIVDDSGTNGSVPDDEENLIVKALSLLRSTKQVDKGMDVKLTKRIPSQAGLGGGSSDAATAILAGNRLWKLHFGKEDLVELAAKIGSDVPFFLYGGTAKCLGRGEIIRPLNAVNSYYVLIAKPPMGLSTAEVFSKCQIPDSPRSSEKLISALLHRDNARLKQVMSNRLEEAAEEVTDWIHRLRTAFSKLPCVAHQLSGSGSCYFGLFSNQKLVRNAGSRLLQRVPKVEVYYGRTAGRLAQHFSDFALPRFNTSRVGME